MSVRRSSSQPDAWWIYYPMWRAAVREWVEEDRRMAEAGLGGATTWSSYVRGEVLDRAKALEAKRARCRGSGADAA